MKTLAVIFFVSVSCAFCAERTPSSQDQWGAVRADTFQSLVDGKAVLTRVSPGFIDCGIKWTPGDKMPINLTKVASRAEREITEKCEGNWTYEHLSFDSYGREKNMWIIQFYFTSAKHGTAVMVCNLKGQIWPFGKEYDEFEEPLMKKGQTNDGK